MAIRTVMSTRARLRVGYLWGAALGTSLVLAGCTGGGSRAATPTAPNSGSAIVSSGDSSPSAQGGTSSSSAIRPIPSKTVAVLGQKTLAPVPISSAANFGTGVIARIVRISHGTVTATGPGSIVGSASVSITVQLRNTGRSAVKIDTVQVNTTYGSQKSPGIPTTSADSKPFSGTLRAGRSATGVYAFAVPTSGQGNVAVTIWYGQGKPTVLLRGSVRG